MLRKLCAVAIALAALSPAASWAKPAKADTATEAWSKKRWVSLDEVKIDVVMKKESAKAPRKYIRSARRARAIKRARAAKAKAVLAAKAKRALLKSKAAKQVAMLTVGQVVRPGNPIIPQFGEIMAVSLATLTPMTDEFIEQISRQAMEIAQARELAEARAYIVRTATPGGTMTRDGVANNVRKFHPELVLRLAPAIREARAAGLTRAGVYSGYRDPKWGVGGFKDLFNSLHGAGMAIDMHGIGGRGSTDALKWFAIAGRHGIFNPYGPYHRKEFNHYQITMTKSVARGTPLRATIAVKGPIDIERMWKVATAIIRYQPYLGPPPPAPRARYAKRHRSQYAKAHHPGRHHARRVKVRYAGA